MFLTERVACSLLQSKGLHKCGWTFNLLHLVLCLSVQPKYITMLVNKYFVISYLATNHKSHQDLSLISVLNELLESVHFIPFEYILQLILDEMELYQIQGVGILLVFLHVQAQDFDVVLHPVFSNCRYFFKDIFLANIQS